MGCESIFLRKPLFPSLDGGENCSGDESPADSPLLPTLLSLALTQTWLWVYSLLNVCVRRRKHCNESKCPVGVVPQTWLDRSTAPGCGGLAECLDTVAPASKVMSEPGKPPGAGPGPRAKMGGQHCPA